MVSSSEQNLSCGVMVNPQFQGWYKRLSKILKILKGATYNIDAENGVGIVSGRADPIMFLKKLKESGLEISWVKTGNPNTAVYGSHGYHGQHQLAYPSPYHYSNPYVPNPQPFEPYGYWSTRHY